MLITEYYKNQNAQLHRETKWGESGQKSADIVYAAFEILGIKDMLDYGCGRGTLKTMLEKFGLEAEIREYDPAIPGKDALPAPADFVACTDVLEHVEPECIDAVLDHIFELTGRYAYFIISCKEASRLLPDGRNAHILVQPPKWWLAKLKEKGFIIMNYYLVNDKDGQLRDIRAWCMKQS